MKARASKADGLPDPPKVPIDRPEVHGAEEVSDTNMWVDDDDLCLDPDLKRLRNAQDIAEAAHRAILARCRRDPNAFIEYVFSDAETGAPLKQAWFHREIQDAFQDEIHKYGIFVLPRDHGKTTQLEGFAIWCLGNNPNLRIKIVCASDGKAKERLFTIIQHLEHNPRLKEVFPGLRPAETGDWTKHKIVVQRDRIMRDASVEALGITSTATGGRADLLLADDVVDRRNALEQPKLRETIKVAWDADWINLLEPNGRAIYICTLWHTADLTHRLLQNPEYRVIRYDINESYDPIWKEKWNTSALKKRRDVIGQREFDRGFRNLALTGDVAVVQPKWIEYWKQTPDLNNLVIFQAHDVSTGTGRDFFSSVTLGCNPISHITYVLAADHSLHTFLDQANKVQAEAARWLPFKVGIEATAYQVSLVQYIDATTALDIVPLHPRVSKWLRLSGITPYFERGQILFNPALRPENIAHPLEMGDLVTELIQFPLGANDDMVDAFVHAFNLARDYLLEEARAVEGVSIGVSEIGGSTQVKQLPAYDSEDVIDVDFIEELEIADEAQECLVDIMDEALSFEEKVVDLTK